MNIGERIQMNVKEHMDVLEERKLQEMNSIQVACERLDCYTDNADFLTKLTILEYCIKEFRQTEHEIKVWNGYKGILFREV